MPLTNEEIANRVGFHKATIEGANATLPKHAHLRRLFLQVMTELNAVMPDGRASTVAMTHLEDASMWAHKAVAELAPLVDENQSQDTADLERQHRRYLNHQYTSPEEPVNVDTPVLEKPSAVEMRAWILNHYEHFRGVCKLPNDKDVTFITWLAQNQHITSEQFKAAYPDPTLDEINKTLAKQFEGLRD